MTDIAAVVAKADLPVIVGSVTQVKREGKRYKAICPFHEDHNPSLGIYHAGDKWRYRCYACEEEGDALDFVMNFYNIPRPEGLERLGAEKWQALPGKTTKARSGPAAQRITSKPPADAPEPSLIHPEFGKPLAVFPIRDFDGSIISYEVRYADKEGKKQPRIWTWGAFPNQVAGWRLGVSSGARPLYGLERLALRPDAPVACFEGPKKADAGHRLLGSIYCAVSWTGGHSACLKHDWSPLKGRSVLIWPDNDRVGLEAANRLAAHLQDPRGYGCNVRLLDPSKANLPDGWDIADWQASAAELAKWAKPFVSDWKPVGNPTPTQDAPETPVSDAGPPEPSDAFPPEASVTRPAGPKRGHIRVVGGTDVVAPAEPGADVEAPEMSEIYLADCFAQEHKNHLRYCADWGEWLHYDGDGWRRDNKKLVDKLAVQFVKRAMTWREARHLTPLEKRRMNKPLVAGSVRDGARSNGDIASEPSQWDADPYLVGVPGGVFDIQTGKLIEAAEEQFITQRTAVAPANGTPRRWLEHLNRMFEGDQAVIDFMQLFFGYCATGDASEQCFLFLFGPSGSGKGVALLTVNELLGSYGSQAEARTFMETKGEHHSSEIARFRSKRMVVIDETSKHARWNEERMKRHTGGGRVTAALKHRDEEDIPVTWKLAFAGNDKPGLRSVGREMERRIRLVKCGPGLADEAMVKGFQARMIAEEGPQILNWVLQGAVLWKDSGLSLPESISSATREYMAAEDIMGDWIEECTLPDGDTKKAEAHRAFNDWLERRGDRAWSSRAWWSELEVRGYQKKKSNGIWYVTGLALRGAEMQGFPDAGR